MLDSAFTVHIGGRESELGLLSYHHQRARDISQHALKRLSHFAKLVYLIPRLSQNFACVKPQALFEGKRLLNHM